MAVFASAVVVSVHQHVLRKALEASGGAGFPYVDRVLLSMVFHCSKDDDHKRAAQDVEAALTCMFSLASCTFTRLMSAQV